MIDPSERTAGEAVVRAVRFPTTVRGLSRLGVPRAYFMPAGFVVLVDKGRVTLHGRTRGKAILSMPASAVSDVGVRESRSSPLYQQVALAIVLTVKTGAADVELPIVPISDDGSRSLTGNVEEVRMLADRLKQAIADGTSEGAPEHGARNG